MPALTLRHINSVTVALPHLAASSGARSLRLLLVSLPARPSLKYPSVPDVTVRTVDGSGWIEAVYSNKQKLRLEIGESFTTDELFRKVSIERFCGGHVSRTKSQSPTHSSTISHLFIQVEAPAKELRLKEEGL